MSAAAGRFQVVYTDQGVEMLVARPRGVGEPREVRRWPTTCGREVVAAGVLGSVVGPDPAGRFEALAVSGISRVGELPELLGWLGREADRAAAGR